ncbi:hypothetical protein KKD52_13265 [Myxococcota bacterium]|nr:hypothetical protein [Myxococcota bacterium]MBU1412961.1 hypothetical protein [Myxococcota bacterium]MBU1511324.1 hypothetical protein [Myxococcota bacterium]
MALILTVVETHKGVLSQASLGALEVGRQVASSRGATLYAVLLLSSYDRLQQDLVAQLSAYRADRVVLVTGVSDPPCHATWVRALIEVVDRFPPTFLLWGATSLAAELAPFICIHLKGIYAPLCTIDTEPQLKINWYRPGTRESTEFFEEDLENAVVALVHHGPRIAPTATSEIEVIAMLAAASESPKIRTIPVPDFPYGSDTLVAIGSLAGEHEAAIAAWCEREEWPLLRLNEGSGPGIAWWKTSVLAMDRVILIGCNLDEYELCESVLPSTARWLCLGCEPVPTETWIPRIRFVPGSLATRLPVLFEQEL